MECERNLVRLLAILLYRDLTNQQTPSVEKHTHPPLLVSQTTEFLICITHLPHHLVRRASVLYR